MEIAQLVAAGSSNKEIAAQLGVSVQHVKNTVSGIYRRLKLANRAAIVASVRKPPEI